MFPLLLHASDYVKNDLNIFGISAFTELCRLADEDRRTTGRAVKVVLAPELDEAFKEYFASHSPYPVPIEAAMLVNYLKKAGRLKIVPS